MRIKVNPKENLLTGDKMKRSGGVAENHMKKVHNVHVYYGYYNLLFAACL